jgi:hypothetical protein
VPSVLRELVADQPEVVDDVADAARRCASWLMIASRSRLVGSKRLNVWRRSRRLALVAGLVGERLAAGRAGSPGTRACPRSSDDRTSSGFTSGSVFATGIVPPLGSAPASLRARVERQEHVLQPVFGRSSTCALR